MIDIKDLCKVYLVGDERVRALDHATLHIYPKEFVSIIGPSGSGKSTLMNIIGCLDIADAGSYRLDGLPIEAYSENQLAKIRNQKIGFVFQSFNLIPKLSAEENVELPLIYQNIPLSRRRSMVMEAMDRMGVADRAKHHPAQMSGGQQQRVAIARAIAAKPPIIMADEPTGALDSKTGQEVLGFLQQLNKEGSTIILITHDNGIAATARRVVRISDGVIIEDREQEVDWL